MRAASVHRAISRLLLAAVSAGLLVGVPGTPWARATWSDTNCTGGGQDLAYWKRSQALSYAQPMAKEGYEWNGGCYKLNDRDDTPGAPDSGGEGNDCSGFVYRVWALKGDGPAGQYRLWDYNHFIHGPYYTNDYYDPQSGDPFQTIPKTYTSTVEADAFVYRNYVIDAGHIGMIYKEGAVGSGSDTIIEAKGDADGTGIWVRDYRSQSAYRGVARKQWTPECYPRCYGPARKQAGRDAT